MFLIRILFWLVIIIALVPGNMNAEYSVYRITSSFFTDVGNFCSRNPDTCEQSQVAASHFKDKAVNAGEMVWHLIQQSYDQAVTASLSEASLSETSQNSDLSQPSIAVEKPKRNIPTFNPFSFSQTQNHDRMKEAPVQNTLRAEDLEVEWLAPP